VDEAGGEAPRPESRRPHNTQDRVQVRDCGCPVAPEPQPSAEAAAPNLNPNPSPNPNPNPNPAQNPSPRSEDGSRAAARVGWVVYPGG